MWEEFFTKDEEKYIKTGKKKHRISKSRAIRKIDRVDKRIKNDMESLIMVLKATKRGNISRCDAVCERALKMLAEFYHKLQICDYRFGVYLSDIDREMEATKMDMKKLYDENKAYLRKMRKKHKKFIRKLNKNKIEKIRLSLEKERKQTSLKILNAIYEAKWTSWKNHRDTLSFPFTPLFIAEKLGYTTSHYITRLCNNLLKKGLIKKINFEGNKIYLLTLRGLAVLGKISI